MIASVAWVLFILLSGGISASSSSSSSSGGTYTPPVCEATDGFYCPRPGSPTNPCLPRSDRCTGEANAEPCIQKTYQHCDYDSASGKFKVYRHASKLQSFSSSRSIFECLSLALEHQFITYRGLMYEFGQYGSRVQDPNDPDYEYNIRAELGSRLYLGLSSCTYQEVKQYTNTWKNYDLCRHNCQHFAKGLGEYLTTNCAYVRRQKRQSDDDLAEYIFSIAGTNCTEAFTVPTTATPDPDGSQSVSPLPLVVISTTIIVGVLVLMQL